MATPPDSDREHPLLGRTFGDDEVIVSKSDLRGRITYVNDVFLRVSAYQERDVIGRPHSILRHPEMPRLVFAMLWDNVRAGEEIFAYVRNRARDGAHYWVFAHVTPTVTDGSIAGYHSNRRSPDVDGVAQVAPIYAELLAAERPHGRPSDAVAASRSVLDSMLSTRAMTYDEFVWSLAGSSAR